MFIPPKKTPWAYLGHVENCTTDPKNTGWTLVQNKIDSVQNSKR